jgi:hypothetical protein
MFTFGGKGVIALYDKINWNIKTYKLKLLKLLKFIKKDFCILLLSFGTLA